MKLPKLVQCIAKGVNAKFIRYSDRALWYQIEFWVGEGEGDDMIQFEFPIPVEDTHGGTFSAVEPASIFQRWIRKHLEFLAAESAKAKAASYGTAYNAAAITQEMPAVDPAEPDTDPASEEG